MKKSPGIEFDVELNFSETGLEPTIVILDDQGDPVYGPTTDGILELEVASQPTGAYLATIPDDTLTVEDDGYTILASKLGTFDPDTDDIITIDLEITSSLGEIVAAPTGRDLCTLEDVIGYVPAYESEEVTDAKLQQFITSESELIMEESGREVTSAGDGARVFDIDRRGAYLGRVHIGDCASISAIDVLARDGTVAESVDLADVVKLYGGSRQPSNPWEPITALEFRTDVGAPILICGQSLRVTAEWGFRGIPAFAREGCAAGVILRYISDVASSGTDFAEAVNTDTINIRGLSISRDAAVEALTGLVFA